MSSTLTATDIACAMHHWLGQAEPTMELTREARQELALWPKTNFSRVSQNWDAYKPKLRTGIHAMAGFLAQLASASYCMVVTGDQMREGIAWLEKSRTPLCPADP